VIASLALASVPIALALGRLAFGQIIVVAFLAGPRQVIYSLGEQGALPLVVHVSQVPEAVIRNQARSEAAMLAGPPLGGVLFGLAGALPFIANAISYVMSALGVLLVQTPLQEPRTAQRRGAVTEIVEGLRWFGLRASYAPPRWPLPPPTSPRSRSSSC